MLSTPKNNKSILVTTSRQSITIPVTLYKTENGKITETTALINSVLRMLVPTHSFLPASWAGDTHEETDFLPISDREE